MAREKWINSAVLHNALGGEGIPYYVMRKGIDSVFTLSTSVLPWATVPLGAAHWFSKQKKEQTAWVSYMKMRIAAQDESLNHIDQIFFSLH